MCDSSACSDSLYLSLVRRSQVEKCRPDSLLSQLVPWNTNIQRDTGMADTYFIVSIPVRYLHDNDGNENRYYLVREKLKNIFGKMSRSPPGWAGMMPSLPHPLRKTFSILRLTTSFDQPFIHLGGLSGGYLFRGLFKYRVM